MSRIGQERIDRPAGGCRPQPVDTSGRREIRFNDGDVGAETAAAVGGLLNLWSIGGNEQVEPFLRTNRGQFESDARRGPCDDCEWFTHRSPPSSMSTDMARR